MTHPHQRRIIQMRDGSLWIIGETWKDQQVQRIRKCPKKRGCGQGPTHDDKAVANPGGTISKRKCVWQRIRLLDAPALVLTRLKFTFSSLARVNELSRQRAVSIVPRQSPGGNGTEGCVTQCHQGHCSKTSKRQERELHGSAPPRVDKRRRLRAARHAIASTLPL